MMKASEDSHLWRKSWKALAMLKLEVMLSVKTNLSTRPVSFNTKPELEVYRLTNNAGSMLYGEHKRLKKRLKAAAVDVPRTTSTTST